MDQEMRDLWIVNYKRKNFQLQYRVDRFFKILVDTTKNIRYQMICEHIDDGDIIKLGESDNLQLLKSLGEFLLRKIMKLRITYRKQEAGKIELSVDTELSNQQIYTKVFVSEENAYNAIKMLLKAAKVDIESIQPPIEFNEEFGSFVFDVKLDFANESDYLKFCENIIKEAVKQ